MHGPKWKPWIWHDPFGFQDHHTWMKLTWSDQEGCVHQGQNIWQLARFQRVSIRCDACICMIIYVCIHLRTILGFGRSDVRNRVGNWAPSRIICINEHVTLRHTLQDLGTTFSSMYFSALIQWWIKQICIMNCASNLYVGNVLVGVIHNKQAFSFDRELKLLRGA